MPDFSPLSMQLAFLKALLITLSPVSVGVLLTGLAVLGVAVFGLALLPLRWKLPATLLGAGLITLGLLWQLAEAEGGRKVLIRSHNADLQAEATRAELAEQTAREIGAEAVRRAEEHEADLKKLKGSDHAADVHPNRDRIAVPRDLARGLRSLRGPGTY